MLVRVGPKSNVLIRKGRIHTEGHKEEAQVTREGEIRVRRLQGKEQDCSSWKRGMSRCFPQAF